MHQCRSNAPVTVLATDRAPRFQDRLVKVRGKALHFLNVLRIRKIKKRAYVQLAVTHVAKQRGGHLVRFQYVLHGHQEIR